MRLGHLLGQILPIVQNASAASTVTGGFCLFSQVSLPGSEKSDPGIPESSREFPLPGIPIVAPCSTILYDRDACTVLSQKWMEQNSFRPLAVGCDNESLEACAKVGKLLARVLRH